MRKPWNSGQNIVEVAILFALVTGVVATMQLYVQRGVNARYKAGADYVHRELVSAVPAYAGLPRQYDPYYAESWQEDNTNYTMTKGYSNLASTTAGFPDTSVNRVDTSTIWGLTDVPGVSD